MINMRCPNCKRKMELIHKDYESYTINFWCPKCFYYELVPLIPENPKIKIKSI
jgi:hypothetical protein